jgi:hypothetical protein
MLGKVVRLHPDREGATEKPTWFASHQFVKWSAEGVAFARGFFVQQFGEGPFQVSSVTLVPSECTSPSPCRDGHRPFCPVHRLEILGHSQMVELGALLSPFDGYPLRVSGRYLRRV